MDEIYWFWLCNIENIWQPQIKLLIDHFGSPYSVFNAKDNEINTLPFFTTKEKNCIINAKKRNLNREFESLEKKGISFITYDDPLFPDSFRHITDPPFAIYYKGNLPDVKKYSLGMVGARICSEYGKRAAYEFSSQLAAMDIQIISGMAYGIDACASKAAIGVGGKTFVVLGTGVDRIYPKENSELYYEILMSGGGIISEYRPGSDAMPWQFPHRNRLISALSDKLLIIEAKKLSGTLTTARCALEQGVDIYALPGRIYDRLSEGCNDLIADGSGILKNTNNLLEDLYSRPPKNSSIRIGTSCKKRNKMRSDNNIMLRSEKIPHKEIFEVLCKGEASYDVLLSETSYDAKDLSVALSELMLTGFIDEVSKGIYAIK